MHHDLAVRFVEVQALLLTPIAPHIAEHLWSTVLSNKSSVQLAQFPKAIPTPEEDRFIVDAGVYVRTAIKNIRDAELKFHKNKAKGKTGGNYDPSKPKGIKVYVSSGFPEWQEIAVGIVKDSFDGTKVDDKKVKEELEKRGLIKEKKYMPFVAMFKVCFGSLHYSLSHDTDYTLTVKQKKLAQLGPAVAFNRAVLFNEKEVMETAMPYIVRQLGIENIQVNWVKDVVESDEGYSQTHLESAEPGNPTVVFFNTAE